MYLKRTYFHYYSFTILFQNTTVRNLTRPLMFVNEFVRPGSEEEITLLDIASGHLEHLNLKHVVGKIKNLYANRNLLT